MSDISFYLQGIEMGARIVRSNVLQLPSRPPYETLAEEALEEACRALSHALETIVQAQAEYQSKPVDG